MAILIVLAVVLASASCYYYYLGLPTAKPVLSPEAFIPLVLQKKTPVSHNVNIYRLKLPTETSVLGLPIGQHISISASKTLPEGSSKEFTRSYTPISGDDLPGHVDLLIKTYPDGNVTQYLESLSVGQPVRVRGPKSAFKYTPNMARRIGMIAGGTGITPMFQILNSIAKGRSSGDVTEVDLIFANVTAEDILMRKELEALALISGIRVHLVLDRPPPGWKGAVGYVTSDMIKSWLPGPSSDIRILLCGPPPMVSTLKKTTETLGYDKARPVSRADDQVFCF